MKRNKQQTVVVGMSGGVDSSLTAALLKEQGYFVIGVYMKNWSEPIKGVEHCPWVEDQLDARRVAQQLNIPFYAVNFEKLYKKQVIDPFFTDYKAGRTPNPDVLCNRFIKFDAFLTYAQSLGADYIATGHYARVAHDSLLKGVDPKKDQSYFLWAIDPAVIPFILFPLGHLTKGEVRREAKKRNLVTANKRDSQGICFIGQADVRDFLKQHIRPKKGAIINQAGQIIGTHDGAWFYTIGQRIGIADVNWKDNSNRPLLYALNLNVRNNTVTAGEEQELYHLLLQAKNLSWLGAPPKVRTALTAKIRYGQPNTGCVIVDNSNRACRVLFSTPQRAITPGQSIVFYDGDKVVGGGIIDRAIATILENREAKEARVTAISNQSII